MYCEYCGTITPDYSRLVLWIQGKYGSRFAPGMDANKVRWQLEAIITSEQVRGIPQRTLKGFRSFIEQLDSGSFLQPRR